ncbi:MAG: tetraacyldisaccharide 4'-kinase [Bacteroidetes bacterium]|nr:tetraacyldisaccharide 4'-kinase [Bacteroidota bacterium]MCL2303440.1 tetraacyldisaccharide 4'-kinase [Lentimicrobiaceae bacterium]
MPANRKPQTANRIPRLLRAFLLSPFSLLFGTIAAFRRKAFRKRSKTFAVPTICVGNLRVGGTGKTPHVEYIANFLSQNHQVAILSRGYGRKTKGYLNAGETQNLSSELIGDEPMQYAVKFPNVEVAVCEKRKTGIEKLLQKNPELEAIILDDAYQHLSVNYSLRILLTEYHRPFFEDFPLPSGNLRECRSATKHADILIVTKCPESLTNEEKERFLRKLKLQQHQDVFFTKIKYAVCGERWEVGGRRYEILSPTAHRPPPASYLPPHTSHRIPHTSHQLLLLTGIANPAPLVHYLKTRYNKIHKLHFPDHHAFTNKDIEKIIHLKEKLGGENCTIITTEKDAVRLQVFQNMPEYHVLPIEIIFLENEAVFKEKLLSLLKT